MGKVTPELNSANKPSVHRILSSKTPADEKHFSNTIAGKNKDKTPCRKTKLTASKATPRQSTMWCPSQPTGSFVLECFQVDCGRLLSIAVEGLLNISAPLLLRLNTRCLRWWFLCMQIGNIAGVGSS